MLFLFSTRIFTEGSPQKKSWLAESSNLILLPGYPRRILIRSLPSIQACLVYIICNMHNANGTSDGTDRQPKTRYMRHRVSDPPSLHMKPWWWLTARNCKFDKTRSNSQIRSKNYVSSVEGNSSAYSWDNRTFLSACELGWISQNTA